MRVVWFSSIRLVFFDHRPVLTLRRFSPDPIGFKKTVFSATGSEHVQSVGASSILPAGDLLSGCPFPAPLASAISRSQKKCGGVESRFAFRSVIPWTLAGRVKPPAGRCGLSRAAQHRSESKPQKDCSEAGQGDSAAGTSEQSRRISDGRPARKREARKWWLGIERRRSERYIEPVLDGFAQ